MRIEDWRVSDIEAVVRVKSTRPTFKQFGPRHYHGLIIQLGGISRYTPEGQETFTMETGCVLYLSQGTPYTVSANCDGDCICINFYLIDSQITPAFQLRPHAFSVWKDLFFELLSLWNRRQTGSLDRCFSRFYGIIAMVCEQQTTQLFPAFRLAQIERFCEQLKKHLDDPSFSLEEAVQKTELSETHMRNQFRKIYGMAPKQYLIFLRMSQAKDLLTTTDDPVHEVALKCGYDNPFHFSKAFKAVTGMSPSEYKKTF